MITGYDICTFSKYKYWIKYLTLKIVTEMRERRSGLKTLSNKIALYTQNTSLYISNLTTLESTGNGITVSVLAGLR